MEDIRVVMDAVGWERATIYGLSEGGPLACLFAATYPERTERLILQDSYARAGASTWVRDRGRPRRLRRVLCGLGCALGYARDAERGRLRAFPGGRRGVSALGAALRAAVLDAPEHAGQHGPERRDRRPRRCCPPSASPPSSSMPARIWSSPSNTAAIWPRTSRGQRCSSTTASISRYCVGVDETHGRDRGVRHRRGAQTSGRPGARHGGVHRHLRLDRAGGSARRPRLEGTPRPSRRGVARLCSPATAASR